ncbi:DUF1795 domain-containing protein [Entomomonas sp. E2T0]|uniref:DUF1795 domain-containing protein n=1 Tax=Entomomonas sp. E2T0 TaxID=2930213 RepID=UPI0022284327|nr:DUF1795 domain-containing protein [Entomomonas sp. E2T0]UYZ82724.1 DUF1795 domain-containing protein [Entomomonas sp. E2T0]
MKYHAEDIQIDIPSNDYRDMTLNILSYKALEMTIVIGRGLLNGKDLATDFNQQMKKLQKTVDGFKNDSIESVKVGLNQDIEAVQTRNQFLRNKVPTYQFQLLLQVPDTQNTIAINYVKQKPLDDADKTQWDEIKASIDLSQFKDN